MESLRKKSLWVSLLGYMGSLLLHLNGLTWRKELVGVKELDSRLTRGERVLLCFWHGKYLSLLFLLRGRNGCVFTSRSFRGEVIFNICHRFGYDCVEIPEFESAQALKCLRDAMGKYQACGIAIDGPRGPYHVVKRTPVQLASSFGFVILPVSVASRHSFVFRSRWDRMELPRPFTKVCLVIGEAIRLPAALSSRDTRAKTREIREKLDEIELRAKRQVSRSNLLEAGKKFLPPGVF
ncbi:MAG: DUF374 domain-containing protein [Deltaproteobacteria bacterium]|nr:DUF374 domain-containing protein [Deltaproteobacteria bacterium]